MGVVQIEVFEQESGLRGGREVWFKVLSNTVVDWPDVKAKLTSEQQALLDNLDRPSMSYFPHLVSEEERADHGFALEDWWTFAEFVREPARVTE